MHDPELGYVDPLRLRTGESGPQGTIEALKAARKALPKEKALLDESERRIKELLPKIKALSAEAKSLHTQADAAASEEMPRLRSFAETTENEALKMTDQLLEALENWLRLGVHTGFGESKQNITDPLHWSRMGLHDGIGKLVRQIEELEHDLGLRD